MLRIVYPKITGGGADAAFWSTFAAASARAEFWRNLRRNSFRQPDPLGDMLVAFGLAGRPGGRGGEGNGGIFCRRFSGETGILRCLRLRVQNLVNLFAAADGYCLLRRRKIAADYVFVDG